MIRNDNYKEVNWAKVIYNSLLFIGFLCMIMFLSFSALVIFVGSVRMFGARFGMLFSFLYIAILICIFMDLNSHYFGRDETK